MSEPVDVDSDWKRARTFLITFSSVVLAAWYFSADVKSLSILGLTLNLRANSENIWAVIGAINLYFIFRLIQKQPNNSLAPDDSTRSHFEKTLITHTLLLNHKNLLNIAKSKIEDENKRYRTTQSPYTIIKIHPHGEMRYRTELKTNSNNEPETSLERLREYYKHTIKVHINYTFTSKEVKIGSSSGFYTDLTPNKYIVFCSMLVGWAKGCMLTPWMSDYVLPIALGSVSTLVALCSWLSLNYPNTF